MWLIVSIVHQYEIEKKKHFDRFLYGATQAVNFELHVDHAVMRKWGSNTIEKWKKKKKWMIWPTPLWGDRATQAIGFGLHVGYGMMWEWDLHMV